LWLPDGPVKIRHLVHHVEQRLARLFVVEWRVGPVRLEPSLRPEGIDAKRLQIWALFNLGDEVERRLLPPVHSHAARSFAASQGSAMNRQITLSRYAFLPAD
jgi:hypothetical protein